jgi:glycosyltransferase AglD
MMVKQSFIFPIHNEEAILVSQLRNFVKKVKPYLSNDFEIILVENGSKDRTAVLSFELSKRFKCINFISLYSASYGQAIKKGIELAKGNQIFVLNIDYYDSNFIKKAIALLPHIDIVIGSKTLSASQDQRSAFRRLMTYFFNVFLRLVLNFPGTDTHGIKAFANNSLLRKTIKRCRTKNELFDTELVIRLTHKGALFVDLPQVVKEIRPSRYVGMRRLISTIQDILIALNSKYLGKEGFESALVDADDFGISVEVNKEILKQAKNGKLNIVSILSNLVDKESLDCLKKNKKLYCSLHFNLLRGKPLVEREKVQSLVGTNGNFYPLWFFVLKLMFGRINFEEVRIELWAQYHKLKESGFTIKYINSEQHVHTLSPINSIIERERKLMNIEGVRSIRSTTNYLRKKPFRFSVFFIIRFCLNVRYSYFSEFKNNYHSFIIHPGTNYDN